MDEIKNYPLDMANKMINLGSDWVDKNAAAELLEETRKSVRAKLCSDALDRNPSLALGKVEIIAESSEDYQNHIKSMVEARRVSNIAKVNFDAHRVLIDMTRTLEATKRSEMNMR